MSEEALDLSMEEMMMLKRGTKVSKLLKEVKRPQLEEVGGLPLWKTVPLGVKLPMMPAPPGAIQFTRGRIGSKLWIGSEDAEFCLADPYCRDVEYVYESLHDGSLKKWFKKPGSLAPLVRNGLVTEGGIIKCSLKQFNAYRNYLNRLHTDSAGKEQLRREARAMEESMFRKLQENAIKENNSQLQREKMKEKFDKAMEAQRKKEKETKERLLKRAQQADGTVRRLRKRVSEESALRKWKSNARDLKIKRFIAASKEIQRQKKIITLKKWNENEKERKAQTEKRIKEKNEAQRKKEADRWNKKIKLQEYQMAKEKEMVFVYEKFLAKKQKSRELAVERIRNKFDKELEERKKIMRREIKEENLTVFKKTMLSFLKLSDFSLPRLRKGSQEHSTVLLPVAVPETKIAPRPKAPKPVESVIKEILHRVVFEFVRNRVISQLRYFIIEASEEYKWYTSLKSLEESSINFEGTENKFMRKRSTVISVNTLKMFDGRTSFKNGSRNGREEKMTKNLSFGVVEEIPSIPSEESKILKSSRDRPPTPMPSLTDLVRLDDKNKIERRIYLIMKKLRRLVVWRAKKLSQLDRLSETPIIDEIARKKREKQRGLNVPTGLTKLILSAPLKTIATKKLGPYLDVLAEHVIDPEKYPLCLEKNQLIVVKKKDQA